MRTPFQCGNAAGVFFRTMHAARFELHHAVGIRETTVADAVLERIELDDVHSGNHRIEHVGSPSMTRNYPIFFSGGGSGGSGGASGVVS